MSLQGQVLLKPILMAAGYGAKTILRALGMRTLIITLFCMAAGWLSLVSTLIAFVLLALLGAAVASWRMIRLLENFIEQDDPQDFHVEAHVAANGTLYFRQA